MYIYKVYACVRIYVYGMYTSAYAMNSKRLCVHPRVRKHTRKRKKGNLYLRGNRPAHVFACKCVRACTHA